MIWIILAVVVVFVMGSALPLIKQISDEKQQRKAATSDRNHEARTPS